MSYLSTVSLVVVQTEIRVLDRSLYLFTHLVRQNARARQELNCSHTLSSRRCAFLIRILLSTKQCTGERPQGASGSARTDGRHERP